MSKKNYYLSNGQTCTLIEKRHDGTFLVDPHYYFDEYNEQEYETIYTKPSNTLIIVDKIFNVPPVEAIDADFKRISDEIKAKKGELSLIKKEVAGLNSQKETLKKGMTDINKWVVDISQFKNAKSIACFLKNEPYPSIVHRENDDYSWRKNVITFEIRTHEYNDWVCAWYGRKDGSDFTKSDVDPEYGFYFDISDDELTKIALERNSKLDVEKISDSYLIRCPKTYLTPAMKARLDQINKDLAEADSQRLRNEIAKKQEELDALVNKLAK